MYILKTYLNIGLNICLKALCLSGFLLFLTPNGLAQTANPVGPQTFERVKVLLLQDGKTREVAARLRFTGTEVVIEDASGKALLTAANDEVKAAEYSYSKHRRWKTGAIAGGSLSLGYAIALAGGFYPVGGAFLVTGLILTPVAIVLHHTHSKTHWLTLRAGKEVVMLRLDKRHYRSVITSLENQTKLTVAWQGER